MFNYLLYKTLAGLNCCVELAGLTHNLRRLPQPLKARITGFYLGYSERGSHSVVQVNLKTTAICLSSLSSTRIPGVSYDTQISLVYNRHFEARKFLEVLFKRGLAVLFGDSSDPVTTGSHVAETSVCYHPQLGSSFRIYATVF